jgi:antitoxin component of RelBE/YafQ-DinJ toxin-antitoxin module
MKMENYSINFNADPFYVKKAEKYFAEKGYTLGNAINAFIKTFPYDKSLPADFLEELDYPEWARKLDEEFDQTIADYKSGKIKGYRNIEEMRRDLDAEDYDE